uniref:Uncharacterized protein n=1 Tax=Polytomella parva TaxID=51329 RepID=A0A7S0YDK4_9CHLO|mmetsp:Transcript_19703/g.35541  ORF Transcript_19703/g.35541 Transcript_19703/m.35541 type:complete len:456 (+) Transcript_19703:39-1406(+)
MPKADSNGNDGACVWGSNGAERGGGIRKESRIEGLGRDGRGGMDSHDNDDKDMDNHMGPSAGTVVRVTKSRRRFQNNSTIVSASNSRDFANAGNRSSAITANNAQTTASTSDTLPRTNKHNKRYSPFSHPPALLQESAFTAFMNGTHPQALPEAVEELGGRGGGEGGAGGGGGETLRKEEDANPLKLNNEAVRPSVPFSFPTALLVPPHSNINVVRQSQGGKDDYCIDEAVEISPNKNNLGDPINVANQSHSSAESDDDDAFGYPNRFHHVNYHGQSSSQTRSSHSEFANDAEPVIIISHREESIPLLQAGGNLSSRSLNWGSGTVALNDQVSVDPKQPILFSTTEPMELASRRKVGGGGSGGEEAVGAVQGGERKMEEEEERPDKLMQGKVEIPTSVLGSIELKNSIGMRVLGVTVGGSRRINGKALTAEGAGVENRRGGEDELGNIIKGGGEF